MRKKRNLWVMLLMMGIVLVSVQTFAQADNGGRVYYEIFIRSFADGDGDGIGDFKGLTAKLDYLNDGNPTTVTDLGITGIWLMPINPSPSYHGYDVTDYDGINPEYGTMADFEAFLQAAHARGIKVIMDLVLNHSSRQHPWFQSALQNGEFREYYLWSDASRALELGPSNQRVWHRSEGGYYYALFWDGMPDLNYDNAALKQKMVQTANFWLDKGVDGFRLDAVKHIYDEHPRNHAFLREFREALVAAHPDVYLVGEIWDTPEVITPYYASLDTNFNFYVSEMAQGKLQVGGVKFAEQLSKIYAAYQVANPAFIDAAFLTNHDQNRIMSVLDGNMEMMRLLAAVNLTLPGNPFIYYGEEIGMLGMKPDERIREPFQWKPGDAPEETRWESIRYNNKTGISVEEQWNESGSLLSHYRTLIHLRNATPALQRGDFVPLKKGADLLAFRRRFGEDQVLVIHNLSKKAVSISKDWFNDGEYEVLYNLMGKSEVNLSKKQVKVASYGTVILRKLS